MTKGTVTVSIMHILLTIYLETVRKLMEKKKKRRDLQRYFCKFKMIATPGGDLGYVALRDKRTESTKQRITSLLCCGNINEIRITTLLTCCISTS